MIDVGKILKRAWHILWNYKILWIFGILLALTAGSFSTSGNAGSGTSYQFNAPGNYNPNFHPGPFLTSLNDWFQQNVEPLFTYPSQHIATFIWIGVALLLFILAVGVITSILRYVSETAVIRMVDGYEQSETKVGFIQGWKLGWSRRAFRLWLISLIIDSPVIIFLLLLVGLGLAIFFSVRNGGGFAVATIVAAIGCTFLFLFAFIVWLVVMSFLRVFFARVAVLEDAGVGESYRRGWQMFRRNWKSAALMWLVMLGIGIGIGLASIILFILLIPVLIITAIAGVVVAAIPGLIAFGISSIFASGPVAVIIAILVGLPFFFTVLLSPLILVGGWHQIFTSSVWTLTYREMKALETLTQPEASMNTPNGAG
jgi:hypothetical protein